MAVKIQLSSEVLEKRNAFVTSILKKRRARGVESNMSLTDYASTAGNIFPLSRWVAQSNHYLFLHGTFWD